MNKEKVIFTKKGEYTFFEIPLYIGRKKINKEIAEKNLLDFKKVMDYNKIPFFLAFGTLLGAIRENDFIDYDEDVDIIILDEYRDNFLSILFEFQKIDLKVCRYERDLLSLIRDNEYIDIYFFKKKFGERRVCNYISIPNYFLKKNVTISFLNTKFSIPQNPEKFLNYVYGKDWRIPKKNFHKKKMRFEVKIKKFLKKLIPKKIVNTIVKTKL